MRKLNWDNFLENLRSVYFWLVTRLATVQLEVVPNTGCTLASHCDWAVTTDGHIDIKRWISVNRHDFVKLIMESVHKLICERLCIFQVSALFIKLTAWWLNVRLRGLDLRLRASCCTPNLIGLAVVQDHAIFITRNKVAITAGKADAGNACVMISNYS